MRDLSFGRDVDHQMTESKDTTQRIVVILRQRFRTTCPFRLQGSSSHFFFFFFFLDFSILDDGTDRLSGNVGAELPLYAA
jgi:hypothetical protein